MFHEHLVAIAATLGSIANLALLASGKTVEAALATPPIICLIVVLITVAPGLGRRGKGSG